MNIKVKYDGEFPTLCAGVLCVTIDGTEYDFGCSSVASGGSVTFDDDWNEHIYSGPWTVTKWPENFPEQFRFATVAAINDQISHGCCGGCV